MASIPRRGRRDVAADVSPAPPVRVVLYSAAGCGLCERAEEVVRDVCGDDFQLVAVDGIPELEARYRELLPVVEVDGEPAFTYFVEPEALRERVRRR